MIPEEKQPAVTRALQQAFGVTEFDDIRLLTGGMSTAQVFQIVVRGSPYLLRIIMRTDAMADPSGQFACMQVAAEAGIAPRVWYASVEDRVLITDFVAPEPFPDDVVPLIAPAMRVLHSLPGFPAPSMGSYLDAMDGFVGQFQQANLLPESATKELFRRYAERIQVAPRANAELVASHNDLKPQNIVFDGARIWLVDWEAAFLNDRYVDLAVAANFFVRDDAQEAAYLSAYFGQPATGYQRARFFVMSQLVHMFYAAMFMLLAARSGIAVDPQMTAPDFREFHQQLIAREIDLEDGEAKQRYAKVHLNEMLRQTRTPRFAEALAVVGERHASRQAE